MRRTELGHRRRQPSPALPLRPFLQRTYVRETRLCMVLGWLLADPPLSFFANVLYREWAKCDGIGARSERFPYGQPTGCDLAAWRVLTAFYANFALKWLVSFWLGAQALKHRENVATASSAVTGAGMLILGMTNVAQASARLVGGSAAAACALRRAPPAAAPRPSGAQRRRA